MSAFPISAFIPITLFFATFHLASAQYREFTNADGKSITAMPLKKTDDTVTIRTGTGKTYTLPFAVLSTEDVEFLKNWECPEFEHAVKDDARKSFTDQTQVSDCYIEIYQIFARTDKDGKKSKHKRVAALFGAQTEREVEQGLEMFAGIVRHKEEFLQKNSSLGKRFNLPLTQFSSKFPDGLNWSISVNDESLTLRARGHGSKHREYIRIGEAEVGYLIDHVTDIDADRIIKSYIRTKNRN